MEKLPHLTNLIAAVAVATLAVYVFRTADDAAANERALLGAGARYERLRAWSHRLGGVFLALVSLGLLASAFS